MARPIAQTCCECADPVCHPNPVCTEPAVDILYRVDLFDINGTAMCEAGADDAYDSGLFSDVGVDSNEVQV